MNRRLFYVRSLFWIFSVLGPPMVSWTAAPTVVFGADPLPSGSVRAGAYAQDISPTQWPVWVDGGITAVQTDRLQDPLHARALVIENGHAKLAIVVVDSCTMPVPYVTAIRQSIEQSIGIPASNVVISSTHTHSAPSISGLHSTPVQEDYKEQLRHWIVDAVTQANNRLVPSRVGWTATQADRYIYCRDWLMKPGTASTIPFTEFAENQVQMNPGYDNPNRIRNFEEIDRQIPILAVQDLDGKPIAVLASFCTHYAGSPAVSADYFGVVCRKLADQWGGNSDAFVGLMANGTSGDANCVDFSNPPKPFTHHEVGDYVASRILDALPAIEYHRQIPLASFADIVTVGARVPTPEEVVSAKSYRDQRFPDRLPNSTEENYVRETILLSELPATRDLPIVAMRIGDLAIAANPCETYNVSGLAIRNSSPLPLTMNIGLANGYAGYNPPPDRKKLGGYTAWRARSSCLEMEAEPKMVRGLVSLLAKLVPEAPKVPKPKIVRPNEQETSLDRGTKSGVREQALRIDESLSSFHLDERFQIRAVAWEPQVVDPVDIDFDDSGRLWVVQMGDYPTGAPDGTPLSRIVVLEDTDTDGIFESSHVFADRLSFATGLQLYRDGIIVTLAGQVRFMADRNGDGVADVDELWIDGFAAENPQLRANNPTFAWDQTLYIANGLRGGKLMVKNPAWPTRDQPLELGSLDLHIDLNRGLLERVTGPAQFGLTIDDFGRRFYCSNRNPCIQAILEQRTLANHPLAGLISAFDDVLPAAERSQVHPIVDAWTTSNLHQGQFTAACGVLVGKSGQLPAPNVEHAYVCEPTGSLVHRRALKTFGARVKVAEDASEVEWLASTDSWFRPVNLSLGPDDHLYVVDMHRAVIEHPEWVPVELKDRPDAWWGKEQGRVYAVSANGADPMLSIRIAGELRREPLRTRSTSALVGLLDHPHTWFRRTAARLLFERADSEAVPLLASLVYHGKRAEGRYAALALLSGLGKLDVSLLQAAFQSEQPELIAGAVRLSGDWVSRSRELQGTLQKKLQLQKWMDGDYSGLYSMVLALREGEWTPELCQSLADRVVAMADIDPDDPYLFLMATPSDHRSMGEWLITIADRAPSQLASRRWFLESIRRLSKLSVESRHPAWPKLLERVSIAIAARKPDRLEMGMAIAEGWSMATQREADSMAPQWNASVGMNQAIGQSIRSLIADPSAPVDVRRTAIRIVAVTGAAGASKQLAEVAQSDELRLRGDSLRGWSGLDPDGFCDWSFEQFQGAGPADRQVIFDCWLRSEKLATALLSRLESGALSIRSLDTVQLQALQRVNFASLAPRFATVAAGATNPDRVKVIARYQANREVDFNFDDGKRVYAQHCAACHRMDGVGTQVGPDISDSRVFTPEQLLVSILDPNRSIDNHYFRYRALTADGLIVEGLIVEETAQSVTLKTQQGERVTLDRKELERFQSTGVSMMPEGFENQISEQQMANLIGYIKNWRYPNSIPVSK